MATRRFEFSEGSVSKFWEITLATGEYTLSTNQYYSWVLARHSLRYTPTTTPKSIVGLKSLARTKIGAMSLFAGWKRM